MGLTVTEGAADGGASGNLADHRDRWIYDWVIPWPSVVLRTRGAPASTDDGRLITKDDAMRNLDGIRFQFMALNPECVRFNNNPLNPEWYARRPSESPSKWTALATLRAACDYAMSKP